MPAALVAEGILLLALAGVVVVVVLRQRARAMTARLDAMRATIEAAADELIRGSRTPLRPAPSDGGPPPTGGLTLGPRIDAALSQLDREHHRVSELLELERHAFNRFERAVRAIPEGLVIVDEHGEFVFRNDVATEFAGGRHGDALIEDKVRQLVTEAVHDGNAGRHVLELFGPPRRTMVISARPLLTGGRSVGALAVIEDITERRRLEAVRRDFVANISHELKTPVGALSLLAETLVDEDDPLVSRRLAERMVNEATRLANTIEDLLVLSRIESEESREHEAVSVLDVLSEALNRIRPAAENAGIMIEVSEPDAALAVLGDRRQLVSALYNLLDNAVKYSDKGSEVTVEAEADVAAVTIAVADHGIGIPARDMERVFERFYRVDLARSRQTGGTGLGLSIVRHVMSNHDGEVAVESRLGEGSTFTLRLAIAPAPLTGDDADATPRRIG